MKKRVVTGIVFALLILAGIYFQGWVMRGLLSFAMVVSTYEVYHAMRQAGSDPVRWVGYVFCGLTILSQVLHPYLPAAMQANMVVLMLSVLLAMMILVLRGKIVFESMTATLFPMLYPGIFYMVLMGLMDLKNYGVVVVALVLAFFAASINDVFALFTGMLLGRHTLSPEISPKKTIEGSIGGLIASVLFCMVVPTLAEKVFFFYPDMAENLSALPPVWSFALLGLFAGAFSQIGDLTASMIKRHCGVKDFGNLLPGHGGVMDRMDGILFCGAVCFIFFRLAGLG